MDRQARVVLAMEAPEVAEEVMHFLDRSGRARVVATAGDARQLTEAARQLDPDVVVAEPALLDARPPAGALIAIATRESVVSLRAAIRAGASGYFVWPGEREAMLGAAAAALREARRPAGRATVVGVHGGRGGVGVTFVATHLAAALARRGPTILLDADPVFGDVAHALGAPVPGDGDGGPVHTLADVVALGEDLGADELRGALWAHPSGIDLVLPPAAEEAVRLGPEDLARVLDAATGAADAVVVHLPRELGTITSALAGVSDRFVEVLTLDVATFRAASRMLEALAPLHLADRLAFVVNRAARSEIVPGDVERVFGTPPACILPFDRGVRAAAGRHRLSSPKGRTARRFDRLAAALVPTTPDPDERGRAGTRAED
jgi:Flp pilus assembly CpaE family ATPase